MLYMVVQLFQETILYCIKNKWYDISWNILHVFGEIYYQEVGMYVLFLSIALPLPYGHVAFALSYFMYTSMIISQILKLSKWSIITINVYL